MTNFDENKKILIFFDFNGTIIDKNCTYELAKNLLPFEDYEKILDIDKTDYIETYNYFYKRAKEIGLTLKDIILNLQKIELSPGIIDLFTYLKNNKSKYELVILSSDINFSVKNILKYHGFLELFDEMILNKEIIQEEKQDSLILVEHNQYPHECNTCDSSMCKGLEMDKYIKKNKNKGYKNIFFICDGENDFCPSSKVLKKGNFTCPRFGYKLWKELFKNNKKNDLICNIFSWKSAEEIISKLEDK